MILVTALDDEAARRRGSQLGAEAYLTKPFEPAALVAELQGALEETKDFAFSGGSQNRAVLRTAAKLGGLARPCALEGGQKISCLI